jgi:hypothetical protein
MKDNISGNIDPARCGIKALIPFVHVVIAKEYAMSGVILKFMRSIRT